MKRFVLYAIFCWAIIFGFAKSSSAQWVKEDDTSRIWLDDGIYLSDSSFFKNSPELSWANFDEENWRVKDSLERKRVLVEVGVNDYYKGNLRITMREVYGVDTALNPLIVERRKVFAIVVLGTPYIQINEAENENFVKVTMQGVVSYLQYYRKVVDPFSVTSGTFYNEPRPTTEFVDMLVDFENEEIIKKTKKNLEAILMRDKELFAAYESEKTSYANLMKYINQYNKKHQFDLE